MHPSNEVPASNEPTNGAIPEPVPQTTPPSANHTGVAPAPPHDPVPQASSLHESLDACRTTNEHSPGESCPSLAGKMPALQPEIHEVANLFPPMSDKEFAALVDDIRRNGQREPIWTHQGKVIDGRHRLKACLLLGIAPIFREWTGGGSLLEFVIGLNLHRRHLKEPQRAMIAARMMPKFEEEAKERQLAGKSVESNDEGPCHFDLRANSPEGRSRDQAGQLFGVSGFRVRSARKVLEKGCLALIDAVDRCKIAISTAAALAERPQKEQEELLQRGRKAIAEALRASKPADGAPQHPESASPAISLSPLGEGRASVSETEGEGHLAATNPQSPPPDINSAQHSPMIEQRIADEWLVNNFRPGAAKLSKDEWGFRLELAANPLADLRAALCDERQMLRVIERGFRVVWKR